MEKLPSVDITLVQEADAIISEDNISALIVSGIAVVDVITLGNVMGPFTSIEDVEAAGIDADYDTDNEVVAYKHIKDFYNEAGPGTKLYVMVVAQTVTFAQMCNKDGNYIPKLLDADPNISLIGITRTPPEDYEATYTEQLDNDIWSAITAAKLLRADQFSKGRTPSVIMIEGRDWQGTVSTSKDMSLPTTTVAEFISLVIGNDYAYASDVDYAAKYASVGFALGTVAFNPVQRNIGRVKNGARLGITEAGFSNGAKISTLTSAQLDTMNTKRYIFFRKFTNKTGYFFNGDHCACPVEKDYNSISRCRPIDKVVRIAHAVYTEELLDDIELDEETGKINAAQIKNFQGAIERSVRLQMIAAQELTNIQASCDPAQDVQETNRVKVKINVIPKGMNKGFDISLGYVKSFS